MQQSMEIKIKHVRVAERHGRLHSTRSRMSLESVGYIVKGNVLHQEFILKPSHNTLVHRNCNA